MSQLSAMLGGRDSGPGIFFTDKLCISLTSYLSRRFGLIGAASVGQAARIASPVVKVPVPGFRFPPILTSLSDQKSILR